MRALTLLLLAIFSALPAMAGGLQEGARVRCTVQGKSFTGTVAAVHAELEPLLILNPYGGTVRIALREIRSIRATGKEERFVLPWTFPQEVTYPLFELRTLDGSRIMGAVDEELVFTVRRDADGAEQDIDVDDLGLIEAQ
ncbi:MAG TPA: hypothetical protein VI298_06575 [Geobacteraceae bacterium]